jgi:hypothetical protein
MLDQTPRIGRHEMRIGAEQLDAHRRAGIRPAVVQHRAGAQEGAIGQHALGDPDEFANPQS